MKIGGHKSAEAERSWGEMAALECVVATAASWRRAARIVMLFCGAAAALPASTTAQKNPDNEKTPWPTHYTRTLGPFALDGQKYTVKLSVVCYKETKHGGRCTEDDEINVKTVKIEDGHGKVQFEKKFPEAFSHLEERHEVVVTPLEGREHQALELAYEQLPTHANTGVAIQVFAVKDGALEAMNEEPLEFYGQLGALPDGSVRYTKRLDADDSLPIYVLTSYFYIREPVRLDWSEFRLRRQRKGEFEVAQEAPFRIRPDVQANGHIELYAAPDKTAAANGVDVTRASEVEVLRAVFSEAPPEQHSSANDVWLKIRIDGKEGWIIGTDDYTAVGLSFYQPE